MKRFLGIMILLISCRLANAQGVIFDSISFTQQQEFPVERAALPTRASLEIYLPALYPQTGSTCVAMSLALARTIMYAKSIGTTDAAVITRNQMSPYFLYYCARNSDDYSCNVGLNPIKALTVAQEIGFEKMIRIEYPSYWPFSENFLCPKSYNFLPPQTEQHFNNAGKFKISDFFVTKSISGIKTALAKGIPVIVAMQIPKSFQSCVNYYWKSQSYENRSDVSGHAMVAIGYDDNINGGSFRIANSWGTEWGDKGKVWINYSELEYWLDGAFIMIPSTSTYGSENTEATQQYKLPKSKTFKANDFKGKFNFNNAEYIKIFSSKQ